MGSYRGRNVSQYYVEIVMQVFIVGSPLETAMALDSARLRKQIIETQQILDALNGAKAWSNHPCVLQYKGYEAFDLGKAKIMEVIKA